MPAFCTPDGRELIGYTDRWSAAPGEVVTLMASATGAVTLIDIVALRHGDPNPAGPGLLVTPIETSVERLRPVTPLDLHAGSYARLDDAGAPNCRTSIWVWTMRPSAGHRQVLVNRGELEIYLDAKGRLHAEFDGAFLASRYSMPSGRWVQVAVALADGRVSLAADGVQLAGVARELAPASGPVTLAASRSRHDHFSGKLEELQLDERSYDVRRMRLVNAPTSAVTGRLWSDDLTDHRTAPSAYAAVHFHEDDLEDAGWPPVAAWRVPTDTVASGIYAFRLRSDGLTDHVPFVVTPAPGTATAEIGYLLPTLTYQAYANERLITAGASSMVPTGPGVQIADADRWLAAHPDAGLSAYDRHLDGSGCCLVSQLRPVPNLRPDYVWWNTGSPERFGADLYIADFLDRRGAPWDAFTDHDLTRQGVDLLRRYRVVLTGTHPEYCSHAMLVAIQEYLETGGCLLYLGGNGFYWVTSIDPERPHLAEIRRGVNGTRAWTSRPGELRHQTTGEQGGLWRYRDRPPNRLVGVGFTAQADTTSPGAGYRRSPASFTPDHDWIFAGVSDRPLLGDYGLSVGAAAGYEIDRHDPALGSPEQAAVLMTSAGLHSDAYLLAVEDCEVTIADARGGGCAQVRSDVVLLRYEGGGAVFSVGSCSWAGSLSHNDYDNDIFRITDNVLTGFLDAPSG